MSTPYGGRTPVLGTPGLWFAALGGVSAYAVHLVAGFWLVPVACRTGTVVWLHALGAVTLTVASAATAAAVALLRAVARLDAVQGRHERPASGDVPQVVVGGVLGAMLLGRVRLAGALLVAAAARWGRSRPPEAQSSVPPGAGPRLGPLSPGMLAGDRQRVRFMALVGAALGSVSVLLVVTHWVPVAFFPPC